MNWQYISPQLVQDIKDFCKDENLSSSEFYEDHLEMSQSLFSKILNDKFPLNIKWALKLSKILNVSYEYILENSSFNQYSRVGHQK